MHCKMYFSGQLYPENIKEKQHLQDMVLYLRRPLVLLYSQELAAGKP